MSDQITDAASGNRGPAPATASGAGRPPLLTAPFAILLGCQACFGFAFSAFFLLPKFLVENAAAGAAEVGVLTSVTSVATVFIMIWMGVLVDHLGRKPLIICGGLLMAACSLAFGFVDSMGPLVYLLRTLQALAFAMVFVAGSAMTVDLAPDERLGEALGYFGVTGLATNAVAPAIVEELALGPGWAAGFACAAGAALGCGLLATRLRESLPASPAGAPLPIWRLARAPGLKSGAIVMTGIGAAFAAMFIFHQLFAIELGIERVRSFFIGYAVAAVVARLGFGSLGDRWGRRPATIGALALYTVSVLAMADLPVYGLALIGLGFGFAHGVFYPTYSALVVESIEPAVRGKALALLQAWFNLGIALAGSVLGIVAETSGYRDVFLIAAGFAAVAFAVVVASRRPLGSRAVARGEA